MKRTALGCVVVAALLVAGCETMTPAQKGALGGGIIGTGAGAIIGHQQGHAGTGAAIGGVAGALTGALAADALAQHDQKVAAQARQEERMRHQAQVAPAPAPNVAPPAQVAPQGRQAPAPAQAQVVEEYKVRRVWVPGHWEGNVYKEGHWEEQRIPLTQEAGAR